MVEWPLAGRHGGEGAVPVKTGESQRLWDEAKALMPGGVNSPVRSFASVGGVPRFISRGEGPYLWDADGNHYVDYVQSWGRWCWATPTRR